MAGGVVLYTCAFVLYGLMDVLGLMPQELRSAGVTLPALFSRYYGDQVSSIQVPSLLVSGCPIWGTYTRILAHQSDKFMTS